MDSASINIHLAARSTPLKLLCRGLEAGWRVGDGGAVVYLDPDDSGYNWITGSHHEFDLATFISRFSSNRQKIGLTIRLRENRGGKAVFYPDRMAFFLNLNQLRGEDRIVDFTWYLRELRPFLERVDVETIECRQSLRLVRPTPDYVVTE
ncbi:MAG: hypothetical protein LIQ30_08130 [Planctomycetes bacterium]|nr:hypothetical protein [Planctomycetota bacterium]MCD7897439.1 hypothetical protein [Planctomycetaceae bacterium]